VQALVRPLAGHHALPGLTMRVRRAAVAALTLDSADEFAALLADPRSSRLQLVSLRASAAVWWQVLQRHPQAAAWVAANRALPADIAEHLAGHPAVAVRAALASGGCLTPALMMQLAHDRSEFIRLRLVCNAQATREVLVALTGDACPLVATHAQARLVHDLTGLALPASYLDEVPVLELLH
jgi:hypothetical protein